jgi:hypothetical protein
MRGRSVQKLVNGSIEVALEPIEAEVAEIKKPLAELARRRDDDRVKSLDSIADENEPVDIDTSADTQHKPDKDPSVKTWGEFFRMVGMVALTATEAQKKENIDTRTIQIEQGLKAAKEKGLGEWIVKVAGRSFTQVGG